MTWAMEQSDSANNVKAHVEFEMQSIQIEILQENKSQMAHCSISIKNVHKMNYLEPYGSHYPVFSPPFLYMP